MSTQPILPDAHCLALDGLRLSAEAVVVQVHAAGPTASCPLCGHLAERVHSRYPRTLQDLPWQGNGVRVELTCRKFFCDNPDCSRRVFAEPLPGVARRYARKTTRLADALQQLTWLIGGEAAAHVAHTFGLLLSADALLHRLKQAGNATRLGAAPKALGVDDFAFRKGQRYGTILIDLETRRPVDLLPDRERSTVETWLRKHPGASLISRDRSAVYADAIREAAPEAVQVADRFHLLKNLMETLQQQVGKEAAAIREVLLPRSLPQECFNEDPGPVPPSRRQERTRVQSRKKRFENWQRAHALFGQGYAKKEIARLMDVNVRTVRTYLRATTFPERQRRSPVNSPLTPYKEFLLGRWEEGCQNALQLWREARARGYPGSATAVRDFVFPLRQPGMTPALKRMERAVPSPRTLAWLLALPERRTAEQTALVEKLCLACPALAASRDLTLSFQDMMRRRTAGELESWLEQASASGLSCFASFARGLRADRAAVEAAFSLPWSNGPTEGNVNRLKLIKRQGYGRASFGLLRARVLPLAA